MKSEIDSPSGKLPFEVKAKIFSHLNFEDKKSARRVCPSWRRVVDDGLKFHAILTNKTKGLLMNWCYQPFTLTIEKLSVQNDHFNFRAYSKISSTRHYIIGVGISGPCMINFFQYFNTKMVTLELWNLSLANIWTGNFKSLQLSLKWPSLTHLEICAGSDRGIKLGSIEQQRRHYRAFLELLQIAHFPALHYFNCFLNLQSHWLDMNNKKAFMAPYMAVFDFLVNHAKSLREFDLALQSELNQPFTNGNLISKMFSKLSLTEFNVHFDSANVDLFRFMCAGLKGLKKLKYLEYIPYEESTGADAYYVAEVIRLHGPTLEKLIVHKLNYFDCSCFKDFERMKSLELILLDPRFIVRDAPNLSTITEFDLTAFYGAAGNIDITCESFITLIMNCMPNLVELKAVFHGRGFKYSAEQVYNFVTFLPCLKHLTLFEIDEPEVMLYCCDVPGLTCTLLSTPLNYKYHFIDINRKVYDAQFY